jgi:spore coat protein A, manganese oxidase
VDADAPLDWIIKSMKLSRRNWLKLCVVGGGVLFPIAFSLPARSRTRPREFQQPLIVPPVLKPIRQDTAANYYEITLKKSTVELFPGKTTEIWGYNGITPGPTIREFIGEKQSQTTVRFINTLDIDANQKPINTVAHLHGMAALPQYDGYTMDYIPPNHYKDYVYQNTRASTLWYHDHTMDYTARNINMGLAGLYIIEDAHERSLALPSDAYDIPLILQSKRVAEDGKLLLNTDSSETTAGEFTLINGVISPHFEVGNRKYRFRILNASAIQHYQLALSQEASTLTANEPLTVIASDGGLLSAPVVLKNTSTHPLPVGIAERYEVVIDFSRYPVGSSIFLHMVFAPLDEVGQVKKKPRSRSILRFDITRKETDPSQVPAQLQVIESLPVNSSTPVREFKFTRERGKWRINHKVWDMDRIEANPKPGDIEVWQFVNPDVGRMHPVHLHLVDAQILQRNGLPPRPYERGWKDVFLLGEKETLRVAIRFRGGDRNIEGLFMMHCHQLIHEDNGMMSQFRVGAGGADPIKTAPAQKLPQKNS